MNIVTVLGLAGSKGADPLLLRTPQVFLLATDQCFQDEDAEPLVAVPVVGRLKVAVMVFSVPEKVQVMLRPAVGVPAAADVELAVCDVLDGIMPGA